MKRILPIKNSIVNCIVDTNGYNKCKDIEWSFNDNGYVTNKIVGPMHRFIINAPEGYDVHHINECRFDNRLINLQVITPEEHRKIKHTGNIIVRTPQHYYFRCSVNECWKIAQVLEDNRLSILDYKLPSMSQAKSIVDHLNSFKG